LKGLAAETFAHAAIEVGYFAAIVGVAERKHRVGVLHLRKFAGEVAAHTLSGGVGVEKFGVFGFEVAQFAKQTVEFEVRNSRRIENVVFIISKIQFLSKFFYS